MSVTDIAPVLVTIGLLGMAKAEPSEAKASSAVQKLLDEAARLNNLGEVASEQGDWSTAREYHRKALAIREENSPNSLDVAMSLNNLGLVAWNQGDLAAAREYTPTSGSLYPRRRPGQFRFGDLRHQPGKVAPDDSAGDEDELTVTCETWSSSAIAPAFVSAQRS